MAIKSEAKLNYMQILLYIRYARYNRVRSVKNTLPLFVHFIVLSILGYFQPFFTTGTR